MVDVVTIGEATLIAAMSPDRAIALLDEIDRLRTLLRGLNPYLRRSELPKELYEIILAEMKWEQT